MPGNTANVYPEIIKRLQRVTDELHELFSSRFMWQRTEQVALANPKLVANPYFVAWVGTNFYRSALVTLRALVDQRTDADSIVTVLRMIADHADELSPMASMAELATQDGKFDAAIVRKDVDDVLAAATAARRYVNQHLAHIAKSQKAAVPGVNEVDVVIDLIGSTVRRYWLALQGVGVEFVPSFSFDWSDVFNFPWRNSSASE
jgi:hypothetical protein